MEKKRLWAVAAGSFLLMASVFAFGACEKKEKITIWTAWTETQSEFYLAELKKEFPRYNIAHEYLATSTIASKVLAEGDNCSADIIYSEEYGYLEQISEYLIALEDFDFSPFLSDIVPSSHKYIPELKNSGCVILNPKVLSDANLPEPTGYADLLDEKYKDMISMPNPKSSGTGYMFVRQLTNEWGEDEAFTYFGNLSKNILQFTSSGSGPVNALIQGEVGIGLGMTAQAVTEINKGVALKIVFFDEGAPYSMCGGAILRKSNERLPVKEVFRYMVETLTPEHNKSIFPEQIYKDFVADASGYPQNIKYGNMQNDTLEEKMRLLDKCTFA